MGALAGEVERPRDFPLALTASMVLTTSVDVLAVLIGASVDVHYHDWEDGTFLHVRGRGVRPPPPPAAAFRHGFLVKASAPGWQRRTGIHTAHPFPAAGTPHR